MISACCNLRLPGSSNSPASASQVTGITDAATLSGYFVCVCIFLAEMGFYHVGQASLELLTSGDSPNWASQSAGITGVSHCAQPGGSLFIYLQPLQPYTRLLHVKL